MKDLETKKRKKMLKEMRIPKRDLNFAQAFIAFLLIVFIGVTVIDIAFTIEGIKAEKLATCELRGDCVEVIKNINQ